jgi:hypothetical protein
MADTTEQQQQPKLVDESPISPVERRNSLEAHLKHRPERSELVESKKLPLTIITMYTLLTILPPKQRTSFQPLPQRQASKRIRRR